MTRDNTEIPEAIAVKRDKATSEIKKRKSLNVTRDDLR